MPTLYVSVPIRVEASIDTTISGMRVRGGLISKLGVQSPRAIHPIKRHPVTTLSSSIGPQEIRSPLQETVWPTSAWVTFDDPNSLNAALDALDRAMHASWRVNLLRQTAFHRKLTASSGAGSQAGQLFVDIAGFPRDWGTNDLIEFSNQVPGDIGWPGCLIESGNSDCTWSMSILCSGVAINAAADAKLLAGVLECASVATSNLWLLNSVAAACKRPPFDEWQTTWRVVDNISALVDLAVRAFHRVDVDNYQFRPSPRSTTKHLTFTGHYSEFVRFVHTDFQTVPALNGFFATHQPAVVLIAKLRESLRNPAAHKPWPVNKLFMELGSVPYVIGTREAQAVAKEAFDLAKAIARQLQWFDISALV